MRRQAVISEFKVEISKKSPMNSGFTLVLYSIMVQSTQVDVASVFTIELSVVSPKFDATNISAI